MNEDLKKDYQERITRAAFEWHRDDPRSQKLLHDLIEIATLPFIEKNFLSKEDIRKVIKDDLPPLWIRRKDGKTFDRILPDHLSAILNGSHPTAE